MDCEKWLSSLSDGAKSAGQVANEACKIHVSQASSVQRVCACLSVFFHFGDMKGAAAAFIFIRRVRPDLYSKQSHGHAADISRL